MTEKIKFRNATIEDLDLLDYWDTKQHVIDSDPDDDEWDWEVELPRELEWRKILIAELEGRPIGCVTLYDPFLEETNYWGKDIEANLMGMDIYIGEETDLGKGYGETMILMAFERSFEDPSITAIIIDPLASNVRAIKFYERIGFEFIEARVFGTTDCMYYRLNREKWLDLYK